MYARRRPARPGQLPTRWPGPSYAEMALAGITCVGEFHYLHHGPGGAPYDDPNAMGARADRGRRARPASGSPCSTRCYLTGHGGRRAAGRARSGASATATPTAGRDAGRRARRRGRTRRIGAAVHSVRAVPADAARPTFAERADGRPLHVHLSEQRAENEACLAAHGRTPTELLADAGVLGPTPPPCTPPTSPTPTAPRSAAPAPASASARPPSATSPTASARPGRWPTPAAR